MDQALSLFDDQIANWFDETYGEPTDIQRQAWPKIAEQENLLISAPTGSGKTLTAFLWAINQFVTGQFATGATRVLYISPLKALNNDIQRNLLTPLAALRMRADQQGLPFPSIRVQTRSGDTEQIERRRMLRHPPEILITTPESLNILLTSKSGESMLQHIETVILDEIHGVVGDKRGVYLMSAVERLVPLSGEFQRISLSATVKPMQSIADFVAGYQLLPGGSFKRRAIQCLNSTAPKQYSVSVRYPESAANRPVEEKVWDSLAEDFVTKIRGNTSTLLFVNSRSLAETLTHKINTIANETLAYAHHGSLSREIRHEVEQKLKNGELAAIVATSTLEMGIDIGALDEVLLIQAPEGIASAIQRIGRAGHGVGETSRCTLYPTHPLDFIESAVLAKAVLDGDIEPIKTINCPLDVLAQVIISMTSTRAWNLLDLFQELRRSTPFHGLKQQQFDLLIDMLNGRYGEDRIRELRPKVIVDQIKQTIESRRGTTLSLYMSGGVIPDRGYFQIRHQDSNARIGELDEEFVWEAYVGKVFAFGTQHWQIKKITHNDVVVGPAKPTAIAPPFWKSEGMNRTFHYADRIGRFLEEADDELFEESFVQRLLTDHHLEPLICQELIALLQKQQAHTQAPLPHRHHLLIEKIQAVAGNQSGYQIVFHTGWGNRINRPLGLAMEAAWLDRWGEQPEIFVTDQCLVLQMIEEFGARSLIDLISTADIEQLLRKRLEGSGFFGARFRENAGRALLLSKGKFNERKPLWMSRLQSQKLLDVVSKYEDFPILLETWRTCLQDEFDLENLRLVLAELATGEIRVTEVACQQPSPFAQTVAWDQINEYMYMNDKPRSSTSSNLSRDLLESLVFQPALRPAIATTIIQDFLLRRQRTLPGYEPQTEVEQVEWVKERLLIPEREWWLELGELSTHASQPNLPSGLEILSHNGAGMIVAAEDASLVNDQLSELSPTLLSNWLQYYGPITLDQICELIGTNAPETEAALIRLLGDNTLIAGPLVKDDEQLYYCDAANFEVLLRFVRQAARVNFEPLPIGHLTPFLYRWQCRYIGKAAEDDLPGLIDVLQCLPLEPEAWEQHLLPSRLANYDSRSLDLMMQSGGLYWIGNQKQKIQFCFADNLTLLDDNLSIDLQSDFHTKVQADSGPDVDTDSSADSINKAAPEHPLFSDPFSRYDFLTLLDKTGLVASALAEQLWQAVWKGNVSNDTFIALRSGIVNKFNVTEATPSRLPRSRRAGFRNWKRDIPFAGDWHQIRYPEPPVDTIETEERNKERVRLLLDRYGILFRELLLHEQAAFRWQNVFRSIRMMELAGELYSGYFFTDIPGPQFISPAALAALTSPSSRQLFWLNATDPISACGMALPEAPTSITTAAITTTATKRLPRRVAGNYLTYSGDELILVVEQHGKKLNFYLPPDAESIQASFDVLHHLLERRFAPKSKITLNLINNEPARQSAYLVPLAEAFDLVRDHKSVYLQKKIHL
ncbi:MAG: ATP-dependent Lhr-like helicase [Candidatus Azotimanducaceae bacterium]|jgi:ATP-dependent Lhr-like helicase